MSVHGEKIHYGTDGTEVFHSSSDAAHGPAPPGIVPTPVSGGGPPVVGAGPAGHHHSTVDIALANDAATRAGGAGAAAAAAGGCTVPTFAAMEKMAGPKDVTV